MNWIERRKRSQRRRRMTWLILIGATATTALGGIGLLLPGTSVRSGTVALARSRESIWRILIDLDGMPRWRSDLSGLERLPDLDGRQVWKETVRGTERVLQMALVDPPRRLEMRPVTGSAGDDRIIELTETAEKTGTLVRVTERHSVALLGRLFDRLRLAGGSTPVFLQDLARWLGGDRPLIASQP